MQVAGRDSWESKAIETRKQCQSAYKNVGRVESCSLPLSLQPLVLVAVPFRFVE